MANNLILASASPRRLDLLAQIGITPKSVIPAHIDETPLKDEAPLIYVERIAREKAVSIASQHKDAIILAADTVVHCGSRILPKAESVEQARKCLELLSGRRHRVTTGVCIIFPSPLAGEGQGEGAERIKKTRLVTTMVKFKRLTELEIQAYLASNEWQGKAGGYAIQGSASAFIPSINGSYSNVVGLPLAETAAMLATI